MKYLLYIALFLGTLSFASTASFAQDSTNTGFNDKGKYEISDKDYKAHDVAMADGMRAEGKIYVVVGVILIIFIGIVIYLVRLDGKVSKLEKEFKD